MKKVTKIIVSMLVILLLSTTVFAGTKRGKIDSVYKPGDVTVSMSIGFGYEGITFYPGAELLLSQKRIAGTLPLDFGVAVRGFYNDYSTSILGYDWGWTAYGIGAFGTAHLSFREFDLSFKYLDNLDFYIALGIKYDHFSYTGVYSSYYDSSYGGIGIVAIGGINYFFTEHFALVLEGTYWGTGGGTIGVLYKF